MYLKDIPRTNQNRFICVFILCGASNIFNPEHSKFSPAAHLLPYLMARVLPAKRRETTALVQISLHETEAIDESTSEREVC